jgi:para-nitrobenzyl esterase
VATELNANSIADLRKIPAEDLLKVRTMSGPIIDGYALPTDLYTIFSEGKQNDVPVLTGWNAQEGNFSGPIVDAAAFKQRIEKTYGDQAAEMLKLFPADNDEEAQKSQLELSGLQTFGVQAFKWMQFQNQTGHSKVFMYHFTRALPYGKGQKPYGAFHTGEVPYAYKNLRMSVRPWEDVDYKLSDIMSSYWVNFAKNGDPNGAGLPEWKPCAPEAYETMYLGKTCELKTIPHLKALQLLEKHFESMN